MSSESGLYQIVVTNISGEPVSLSAYAGRVLLIVNVASECGFAKQYQQLQILYDKYHKQGFDVLAFPCNQFGGQEPKTSDEVRKDVEEEFEVNFPIFDKILVNGPNAHPLYKFLKSRVRHQSFWANFFSDSIKWNFTKFVCVNGVPLKRFEPLESFRSIKELIEKYN